MGLPMPEKETKVQSSLKCHTGYKEGQFSKRYLTPCLKYLAANVEPQVSSLRTKWMLWEKVISKGWQGAWISDWLGSTMEYASKWKWRLPFNYCLKRTAFNGREWTVFTEQHSTHCGTGGCHDCRVQLDQTKLPENQGQSPSVHGLSYMLEA